MNMTLAANIALFVARIKNSNPDGPINDNWTAKLEALVLERMPSGSGFDAGTQLDLDKSRFDKLVFATAFHHMTEGSYDGWTEHTVTVRPMFSGQLDIKVSGRNTNNIKDYIDELFDEALRQDAVRL